MRERALRLLRDVKEIEGPLFIFHRSQPKAVLLGIEEYEKMRDWLEDYFDSLRVQEYEKIDKSKVKWVSFEKLKNELGL